MTILSARTGKKIGCVGHDCDGCKAQKREALKTRKALKRLSDTVLVFLHRLDEKVGPDKSIPGETGRLLAAWANDLDIVNDGARYNSLGVDFRKDDKTKAVQKLMRPNVQVQGASRVLSRSSPGTQGYTSGDERKGHE